MTTTQQAPRFLIRHIGNMGDMVLIVPAVLAALKKKHPNCHITFITSWGYKDPNGHWGKRNQSGHSLHLIMTNPNIDQLVHWHDTKLSLNKNICYEDGQSFATWSKAYYESQKESDAFDNTIELDFGIKTEDDPLQHAFKIAGVDKSSCTYSRLYLTDKDKKIANYVFKDLPKPRIMITDSCNGPAMRNWDPGKIPQLFAAIKEKYNVEPIWFGSRTPYYQGRPLTLRENIATLLYSDVCIGVLSGPIHFAAAIGLPTLTLFSDHRLHRAAPAYFINEYIKEDKLKHRTLLGPTGPIVNNLKPPGPSQNLTPSQIKTQKFKHWSKPGRQSTKSSLAVITVDEIMQVLSDMI